MSVTSKNFSWWPLRPDALAELAWLDALNRSNMTEKPPGINMESTFGRVLK